MKFFIEKAHDTPFTQLTYLIDEYSFDMEPRIKEIGFYLAVNYISLVVDENHQIIQLSGFCPYGEWIKTNYTLPNCQKGILVVKNQKEFGFTYGINDEDWLVYLNNDGWICIGDPKKTNEAIEFISNCIAIIENDEMVALWLKPKFVGDYSLIQKSIETQQL